MNLIVDIGNTSTKLALYDGSKKINARRINDLTRKELEKELYESKVNLMHAEETSYSK